jgi:hypothetical protein
MKPPPKARAAYHRRKRESLSEITRRIERELAMPHVQDRIAYDRWRRVFDPPCGDDFIWNLKDHKPK